MTQKNGIILMGIKQRFRHGHLKLKIVGTHWKEGDFSLSWEQLPKYWVVHAISNSKGTLGRCLYEYCCEFSKDKKDYNLSLDAYHMTDFYLWEIVKLHCILKTMYVIKSRNLSSKSILGTTFSWCSQLTFNIVQLVILELIKHRLLVKV